MRLGFFNFFSLICLLFLMGSFDGNRAFSQAKSLKTPKFSSDIKKQSLSVKDELKSEEATALSPSEIKSKQNALVANINTNKAFFLKNSTQEKSFVKNKVNVNDVWISFISIERNGKKYFKAKKCDFKHRFIINEAAGDAEHAQLYCDNLLSDEGRTKIKGSNRYEFDVHSVKILFYISGLDIKEDEEFESLFDKPEYDRKATASYKELRLKLDGSPKTHLLVFPSGNQDSDTKVSMKNYNFFAHRSFKPIIIFKGKSDALYYAADFNKDQIPDFVLDSGLKPMEEDLSLYLSNKKESIGNNSKDEKPEEKIEFIKQQSLSFFYGC